MDATTMEERATILNSILMEQGADFSLQHTCVWKNNVVREGYSLKSPKSNCAPTIYYDKSWYDHDDASVAEYLQKVYKDHACEMDLSHMIEKEYIIEHIKPRLVSQSNLERLEETGMAHIKMLDMAILFYVPVENINNVMGSIQVSGKLLEQAGISAEEAYKAAISNLEKDAEIKTMAEILCGEMGLSPELVGDDLPMWIGSTKNKIQGAAVMLCKSVLDDLQEKIGCKVAILPSSIHEIIAVPYKSEEQFKALRALVQEVNNTQVSPEDKLTDSVYFVSEGRLRLAV